MSASLSPSLVDVEVWCPVPGWPHEASTHGQVRRVPWVDDAGRLHLGGILAQTIDKRPGKGYPYVMLRDGKRRRKAPVSVVVLEAHCGPRPGPEYEACHGNGIRTDSWLSNLRWDTKVANRADRERHRIERAVTDTVTSGPGNASERYGSKVRPGACPIGHPVTAGVSGDGPHGTGRCPIPSTFSFFPPSVKSAFRVLRPRKETH